MAYDQHPPSPPQPPYANYPQQPYGGYPAPQPPPSGVGGLAIAAIIVSGAAFLTGWIPFVGALIAIPGIVLAILAIRADRGRVLGIISVILSSVALLVCILFTVLVFWLVNGENGFGGTGPSPTPTPTQSTTAPAEAESPEQLEATYSTVSGQLIETPCWSYDGPKHFTNNISPQAVDACVGKLELWGEQQADGLFKPTGVGSIGGSINVEPVSSATTAQYATGTDVDAVVTALEKPYLSQLGGTITSLREPVTLGGVPANITRVDSTSDSTQTKVAIVAFAPKKYDLQGDQRQLFIITFVTPYSNGDEQIQQLLDTWKWR